MVSLGSLCTTEKPKPVLSVVVIVHRMPEQAARTLFTLSTAYQIGVTEDDYEIIVVENASDLPLGEPRSRQLANNQSYHYREDGRKSPVFAVNFGVAQAKADHVAILIDGARMLSPGVIRHTLAALRAAPDAVVSVPGYHLGTELQQVAVNKGHDQAADAALLHSIGWPQDGYRLFDIAVLSGSSRHGFFRPHAESNFLAVSRAKWHAVGGMDARYDDLGGGMANLDLYKRLLESDGSPIYLLFAEGTFHQFHGGITTNSRTAERDTIMQAIAEQDAAIRGTDTAVPGNTAILFGTPHPGVYRFVELSLRHGKKK